MYSILLVYLFLFIIYYISFIYKNTIIPHIIIHIIVHVNQPTTYRIPTDITIIKI